MKKVLLICALSVALLGCSHTEISRLEEQKERWNKAHPGAKAVTINKRPGLSKQASAAYQIGKLSDYDGIQENSLVSTSDIPVARYKGIADCSGPREWPFPYVGIFTNEEAIYFIVPANHRCEINWPGVSEALNTANQRALAEAKRKKEELTQEEKDRQYIESGQYARDLVFSFGVHKVKAGRCMDYGMITAQDYSAFISEGQNYVKSEAGDLFDFELIASGMSKARYMLANSSVFTVSANYCSGIKYGVQMYKTTYNF